MGMVGLVYFALYFGYLYPIQYELRVMIQYQYQYQISLVYVLYSV